MRLFSLGVSFLQFPDRFDVVVIGGGHAGTEAALASARTGANTLLLTHNIETLGAMSCNPSIGGIGKGHLVKEIDALGGEMAKIADKTAIQYRTLNTKKGPAVHSSRTQNDKLRYHIAMKAVVENQSNLDLKQVMVERLVVEGGRIAGIEDFFFPRRCSIDGRSDIINTTNIEYEFPKSPQLTTIQIYSNILYLNYKNKIKVNLGNCGNLRSILKSILGAQPNTISCYALHVRAFS